MCRWKPTVTQVQQIGEGDEDTDWNAYYDQEDQGTGDINAIQEDDEIVEILDEDLEGNDFSELSLDDAVCNMIQMGDHDPEEDAFDCFLASNYYMPLDKKETLQFIQDLKLKQSCEKLKLGWGPDREGSIDQINRILEKDKNRVDYVIKKADKRITNEILGAMDQGEALKKAKSMVKEFIGIQKPGNEQFGLNSSKAIGSQ